LLEGVSAGWIGVSMESASGDCLYHVLGVLYGKRPQELKERVKEAINELYDTDADIQRCVRETMREKDANIDERSPARLKADFLLQLDRAWGGSAVVSILAKHPCQIFKGFQLWSVNWDKGGVVRLGTVPAAPFHVFVAHRGNHYYLLSRVPPLNPRVHPYVFSGVDEPQACDLAEWHHKGTAASGTPTADRVTEIGEQEFYEGAGARGE